MKGIRSRTYIARRQRRSSNNSSSSSSKNPTEVVKHETNATQEASIKQEQEENEDSCTSEILASVEYASSHDGHGRKSSRGVKQEQHPPQHMTTTTTTSPSTSEQISKQFDDPCTRIRLVRRQRTLHLVHGKKTVGRYKINTDEWTLEESWKKEAVRRFLARGSQCKREPGISSGH